jgi:hypothetical protein
MYVLAYQLEPSHFVTDSQACSNKGPFSQSTLLLGDQSAASLRRSSLALMMKLAKESSQLPSNLFLKRIEVPGTAPISGGGHADIFSAHYDGQLVALKRFRTFCQPIQKERFHQVGCTYTTCSTTTYFIFVSDRTSSGKRFYGDN